MEEMVNELLKIMYNGGALFTVSFLHTGKSIYALGCKRSGKMCRKTSSIHSSYWKPTHVNHTAQGYGLVKNQC
jgi:hypothetical protein